MSTSDSTKDVKQRLLDLIDRSGVSDRQISLLATNSTDTVRNMRRGICPRLDTIEALCRCLGVRLEIVPLEEPRKPRKLAVEQCPEWSHRLREEIRRDLVEILGHDD